MTPGWSEEELTHLVVALRFDPSPGAGNGLLLLSRLAESEEGRLTRGEVQEALARDPRRRLTGVTKPLLRAARLLTGMGLVRPDAGAPVAVTYPQPDGGSGFFPAGEQRLDGLTARPFTVAGLRALRARGLLDPTPELGGVGAGEWPGEWPAL